MENPIGAIGAGGMPHPGLLRSPALEKTPGTSPEVGGVGSPIGTTRPPEFSRILSQFVDGVNDTQKVAEGETRKVLMGQSDNLHQAMIAGEQSGLAFRLMVEVRNKLVEGFQEVMRMQV